VIARAPRFVLGLALGLGPLGCRRHEPPPPSSAHAAAPTGADRVGRVEGPLTVDGAWREPAWNAHALRAVLLTDPATGAPPTPARPASELRLLADDATLYVGLYAADQDITSADGFDLTVGALTLRVDPRAAITPAIPGVTAAADTDGTVDDATDRDEEWVLELAIPRAALPPGRLAIDARRCDLARDQVRRCGRWSGAVTLPASVVY
jgi:hypothetical protein